ncbi:hypothetical protein JCM16358_06510 [Halanaerocella petrolearia]
MSIKAESLKLAIKLEKKGQKYYQENAEKVDNPLSKKTLKSLANQELDHIETIKDIAAGKEITDHEFEPIDIEAKVREEFEKLSNQEPEGWEEDDVSIYEHALEIERELYDLYEELAEKTKDEKEEEFFKEMMEEEIKHAESLENVLYYFTNNEDWLATEESKVWNWMCT